MFKRIAKIFLWLTAAVVILLLTAVVLLYIPPVQRFTTNFALAKVKESTGMTITVGKLRLKFPLTVDLQNVSVIQVAGDTMVTASNVGIDVKLLPLLKGDIDVNGAHASDVFYQLGTPDSAMWLRANAGSFNLDVASLNFSRGIIDVGIVDADRISVSLIMKDTVTVTPTDTAAAA
ncbi:MAG: hypothetical protein NC131_14955, partial [Roseburia sp.]|nr:hypothetical protein [Roseburia sp.]